MNTKTKSMVYCGLFTALIAVGAFIKVPVPVVPFMLQYLFTMLAGLLLGAKRGAIAVWPLFLYCFILAVPGDIALSVLGAVIAKRVRPLVFNVFGPNAVTEAATTGRA